MMRRFMALFVAVLLLPLTYITFADANNIENIDDMTAETDAEAISGEDSENIPEDIDGETAQNAARSVGIAGYGINAAEAENTGSSEDYVDSETAFWQWIDSHPDGGRVKLGMDVTIDRPVSPNGLFEIDTGAHGVTLKGNSFLALTITGEGVDKPVLTVVNPGSFLSSWDCFLPGYNVTATGRDGEGGVAVHVMYDKDGKPGFTESPGLIRSVGRNAVGVLFDSPVKAHFLNISVEGENSCAVSAPDGASLYYCKLEARGEGAKIASGDGILLDTCRIKGDASGADVVERKILALAESWLYWPLTQGQNIRMSYPHSTFYFASKIRFLLSGNEKYPAEVRSIYAMWDRSAINDLDTSVTGETIVPGKLYEPYQGLGLEDGLSLALTVEVFETGKPYIIYLSFNGGPDADSRYVEFITRDLDESGFKPEYGNFTLWRSDDEGVSWRDITDSPGVSPGDRGVTYYYGEITEPAWFQIQTGGGYSNIAMIFGCEDKSYGNSLGGARTQTDRDGTEPEDRPPPTGTGGSPHRSAYALPSDTAAAVTGLPATPPEDNTLPAGDGSPPYEPDAPVTLPPEEWKDDTTTAISGKRLRLMMSAGDTVSFVKSEVRLSLATSLLKALDVGDNQLFSVTVEPLEARRYMLSLKLDDMELYGLPCVVTLDGKDYDMHVSAVLDFAESPEPMTQIPSASAMAELHIEPDGGEPVKQPDIAEEDKPSGPPVIGFAFLGAGAIAAGAAGFVKLRGSGRFF